MKGRFTTLDLRAIACELQEKFQGMRVLNVYDIDSKTYLIKLVKPDHKAVILLESGIRMHSTDFQWPKNITPSSFSMKLRKHLRTRRLEKVTQLGVDRIVDLQFGSNEAAYHVILELYDRGNIVLTDHEYNILNILRPRTDHNEDVRFAVHEKYPVDSAKQNEGLITQEKLMSILLGAKEGDILKKVLNPNMVYGPALIEHCLQVAGIPSNARIGKEFIISDDITKLMAAMEQAEAVLQSSSTPCKGYIIQKKDKKALTKPDETPEELLTYFEYHPFLFKQHDQNEHIELESFDKAVDEFYSKIGGQKLDMKTLQQERAALKKLDHIKNDHEKRLTGLKQEQDTDMNKAKLVEMNLDLVDRAILVVRSAIANQIDWDEIHTLVKEAQIRGDPVASSIKTLKLDTNHMTMFLKDPYLDSDEEADTADHEAVTPMKIDIDLELSAYANARKYYDKKRKAAHKEQKTVDASSKALKSAERKTFQTLKEVQVVATINKARKTYWYEKFLWFITSENYIVIGGRDQQQNEHIFKKYFRPGDLYVHADLHGASSIVIKNPSGDPVPPKTMNEAGTMALCNSAAWDARVVTSAWWVYHHQVTKTAPTGEYLTTGSFMIRGKKNYLPPSYLIYGFGFLFKVDEDSIFRHRGERKVRMLDDDTTPAVSSETTAASEDGEELELESGDGSESEDDESHAGEKVADSHNNVESATNDLDEEEGACAESNSVGKDTETQQHDSQQSEGTDDVGDIDTGESAEASRVPEDDNTQEDTPEAAEEIDEEGEDDRDEENMFPDTSIDIQYVQGDRLRLQVSRTTSRSTSTGSGGTLDDDTANSDISTGRRISAKQRREMKKKAKRNPNITSIPDVTGDLDKPVGGSSTECLKEDVIPKTKHTENPPAKKKPEKQEAQAPPKRRQKSKLKKMNEKYKDQDEDERRLKMEILASAGPQKEDKRKAKKGKQKGRPQSVQGQKPTQGQGPSSQQGKPHPGRPLTIEDIKTDDSSLVPNAAVSDAGAESAKRQAKEEVMSDDEKQTLMEEENILPGQDPHELDSLTGMPAADDILHFCIPVCAPYSAILNYKYKVKLTPGATKRGKAAKAALHSFLHDRFTTSREKDLFKSLKDVDISRNIPGKVKVSAPNLIRQKKK